jgi:CubicO group peptidase (beta-lactamase class C family)
LDDGWVTASLGDAGLNVGPLAALMDRLRASANPLVHSVLIVVGGQLVLEEYFPGRTHPTYGERPIVFERGTLHCLSSVTKSVTASLLGIAIAEGFIASENEPIFGFLPDYADLDTGQRSNITLKNVVTMSAGLQWDEQSYPIGDPRNDLTVWFNHPGDLVRFVLERPVVADPGTVFVYNGGITNVLGEIIRRATGERLDYFSRRVFAPLGITEYTWYLLRPDFVYASGDISLRPRDMAKLGQLYLQGGVWEGEQVLPAEWVEASASPTFMVAEPWYGHVGYSYGWWPKSEEYGEGAYAASGWGDQVILVMPEHDMVVVFTGGSYWVPPPISSHEMTVEYILPSIR